MTEPIRINSDVTRAVPRATTAAQSRCRALTFGRPPQRREVQPRAGCARRPSLERTLAIDRQQVPNTIPPPPTRHAAEHQHVYTTQTNQRDRSKPSRRHVAAGSLPTVWGMIIISLSTMLPIVGPCATGGLGSGRGDRHGFDDLWPHARHNVARAVANCPQQVKLAGLLAEPTGLPV